MDVFVITSVVVIVASAEGKAAPLKGSMKYEAYHLLNLSEISNKSSPVSEGSCIDHRGKVINDGARYFPLVNDPCTQCTCLNSKPEMCISVFCSPPENCRQFHELNDKCCEFVCLDRDPDKTGNGTIIGREDADSINATNLGLRLVASTVTSFLILALLLFMIHRLHQRRLLLMIRRFHARRVDTGSNGSQRFPLDDEGSVGYLVGGDHVDFSHCSEPPPPYTFWKPPETYIPPGEAPPPYEASIGTVPPIYNGASIRNSISDNQNLECNRDIPQQTVSQQIPSLLLPPANVPDTCLSTSTSETSHTQNIGRHDRVASTSSISMMSDSGDTSSHPDVNTLRSDAHYEDVPVYMPNNVTILHIGQGGNIVSTALCEEDLANGNILPNDMSPDSYGDPIADKDAASSIVRKGNNKSHNCQHKHLSCGDISEWKQSTVPKGSENNKRCSLQMAAVNKVANKAYPDPTSWIGEGSETSSSSGPTYEQCTFSPSSSDSSSMEVDFHLETKSQDVSSTNGQNNKQCPMRQTVFQDGKVYNSSTPSSVREKNTSLDKTLQHFRKFSLAHRKKKKRKSRPDIQEILRESTLHGGGNIEGCVAPYQVCPNSGHTFHNSDCAQKLHLGKKDCGSYDCHSRRPASLCLVVRSPNELKDACSRLKPVSPESQGGCTPVPATVVAVHCSASARVNRLDTAPSDNVSDSPDFSSESVQAYISEQYALHVSSPVQESSPSNPKCGISRSGSICSETGERRYHGSNSPKGIYGCSHFPARGSSSHEKASNDLPTTSVVNKNGDSPAHTYVTLSSVPHGENISSISERSKLNLGTNFNSEENNRGFDIKRPRHSAVTQQESESKRSQQAATWSVHANPEVTSVTVKSRRDGQSRKIRATSSKETDEDLCSSHL